MTKDDQLKDNQQNHVLNEGSAETSAMNTANKTKAMEGEGMGGHNFGSLVNPPSGDDSANPSQNAGYTNEYFRRTEPLEEDTANNNFKPANQEGAPDYQAAQGYKKGPEAQDDGSERIEHIET